MHILSASPARITNKTRFAGICRSKSKHSIAAITISPAVIAANAGEGGAGTVPQRVSQPRRHPDDQPSEQRDADQSYINQQLEIVVVRRVIEKSRTWRRLKAEKDLWPRAEPDPKQRKLAQYRRRLQPDRHAFLQIQATLRHRHAEASRRFLASPARRRTSTPARPSRPGSQETYAAASGSCLAADRIFGRPGRDCTNKNSATVPIARPIHPARDWLSATAMKIRNAAKPEIYVSPHPRLNAPGSRRTPPPTASAERPSPGIRRNDRDRRMAPTLVRLPDQVRPNRAAPSSIESCRSTSPTESSPTIAMRRPDTRTAIIVTRVNSMPSRDSPWSPAG